VLKECGLVLGQPHFKTGLLPKLAAGNIMMDVNLKRVH